MFCTACGAENPASAQFCCGCGARMYRPGTESPKQPATGADHAAAVKCSNCGLINPETAKRCDCGYDFEAKAVPTRLPALPAQSYRWGKFQGWLMVAGGVLMAGALVGVLLEPRGGFAHAFLSDTAPELIPEVDQESYAGLLGLFAGFEVVALGTGVGILKKRGFGLVFVVLYMMRAASHAIRAGNMMNPVGLIFWLGSFHYYFKRRSEFRWP